MVLKWGRKWELSREGEEEVKGEDHGKQKRTHKE